MKENLTRYQILLHITVLVFGLTGIFGKLISLDGLSLVWYRMMFASIGLFLLFFITRSKIDFHWKKILPLIGIGILVALHWLTFYISIKTSNVSIAVACLASGTLFAAFMEPLFMKTKFSILEIVLGLCVIIAIYMITKAEFHYASGIFIGLLSAFLSSLFATLNKKIIHRYDTFTMSSVEMVSGFLFLTIVMFFYQPDTFTTSISNSDLIWLLILASICTVFPFWSINQVLRKLSAFHVILAINLEPVYSIILAIFLFNEHQELGFWFYLGTAIILFSVVGYSLLKTKKI